MEKFIRFGNIEVEIIPDREHFNDGRKESWGDAKEDLEDRELRLPTLKELKYMYPAIKAAEKSYYGCYLFEINARL
jgi:hypothetical protein